MDAERTPLVIALERQNRLLRSLVALTGGGCLLVTLVAAQVVVPPPLIAGESLIIKDKNGIDRFEMVVNPNNGRANGFHVVDATGQTRIDIGVTARGEPVIAFLDERGRVIRTLP